MPTSRDMTIFFANDDDDTTDYFTPCACARGNKNNTLRPVVADL